MATLTGRSCWRYSVADRISEPDEATLHVLAILEGTTVAAQRREAVRSYARQAREDENVAEIVRLMLASRRKQESGGGNVIRLRGNGG
jgi:hypothetical protein